jgi:hypothetical protein
LAYIYQWPGTEIRAIYIYCSIIFVGNIVIFQSSGFPQVDYIL